MTSCVMEDESSAQASAAGPALGSPHTSGCSWCPLLWPHWWSETPGFALGCAGTSCGADPGEGPPGW